MPAAPLSDARAPSPEALAAVARFDPSPGPASQLAASAVALASRFVMQGLNRVDLHDRHRFEAARAQQRAGRGLLTFSNHVGLFDDPWLLACFQGPEWEGLRWVTADALNFFDTRLKAAVFSAGKAVPILRGAGVDQPGMTFLAERLRAGEWVHIFPEGGRSRRPEGRLRRPLKPGLAHLVLQTRPLLLGFHHRGMHEVLPIGARLPRIGRRVTLRFGEPFATHDGLADQGVEAIMSRVEQELLGLEALTLAERPLAVQPDLSPLGA
jgi:monolysocardiolipin acyltransferase